MLKSIEGLPLLTKHTWHNEFEWSRDKSTSNHRFDECHLDLVAPLGESGKQLAVGVPAFQIRRSKATVWDTAMAVDELASLIMFRGEQFGLEQDD